MPFRFAKRTPRLYVLFLAVFFLGLARGLTAGARSNTSSLPSSCEGGSFQVSLIPACPKNAEGTLFFEEAKLPRLSIESGNAKSEDSNEVELMASFGPSLPNANRERTEFFLKSVDLLSENLFQSPSKPITLEPTSSSREGSVSFYVCNDAKGTGRCSDQQDTEQLAVQPVTFPRCHIPPLVKLRVWAGCR